MAALTQGDREDLPVTIPFPQRALGLPPAPSGRSCSPSMALPGAQVQGEAKDGSGEPGYRVCCGLNTPTMGTVNHKRDVAACRVGKRRPQWAFNCKYL